MAKVSTVYDTVQTAVDNNPANRGAVSAYTFVNAVSFNGMRVHKRVRIGVEFGVTVETAKDMMQNLRNANLTNEGYPDPSITGRFIMDL